MMYYLFAIWENINCLLCTAVIFLGIVFFASLLGSTITMDDPEDNVHITLTKVFKHVAPYFIVISTLFTFFPSQKQVAFIIAAPYIIENQDLKEAGKNSAEIIKLGTEYVKDVLTTATTKKGE